MHNDAFLHGYVHTMKLAGLDKDASLARLKQLLGRGSDDAVAQLRRNPGMYQDADGMLAGVSHPIQKQQRAQGIQAAAEDPQQLRSQLRSQLAEIAGY